MERDEVDKDLLQKKKGKKRFEKEKRRWRKKRRKMKEEQAGRKAKRKRRRRRKRRVGRDQSEGKTAAKDEFADEGKESQHELPFERIGYVKTRFQDNSHIRNLKNWEEGSTTQTNPPVRPISCQFPEGKFPEGLTTGYLKENGWRSEDPEMKKKDFMLEERLFALRKAAEVHRQVRKYAQSIARPGVVLEDLCIKLEKALKYIIEAEGIKAGQAFPTGCSLNHVAAHYSPNPGDRTVLSKWFLFSV